MSASPHTFLFYGVLPHATLIFLYCPKFARNVHIGTARTRFLYNSKYNTLPPVSLYLNFSLLNDVVTIISYVSIFSTPTER